MPNTFLKFFLRHSIWLSILLHVLFLLSLLLAINLKSHKEEKSPHYYVPNYIYQGTVKPFMPSSKQLPTAESQPITRLPQQSKATYKASANTTISKPKSSSTSILTSTFQMFRDSQFQALTRTREMAEPILLVGDTRTLANPFQQMVARSLSKYFIYPEFEGKTGIRGKVLIELTLHPEGYFDDVQIVQSSNNQHLDAAALFAVNKAPVIKGVSKYISAPKRFVVGFVFL